MKIYKVLVHSTNETMLDVEANSPDEANEKAQALYDKGEVTFTSGHLGFKCHGAENNS
ncbi:MAG: DpnD/PcfM family protein [Sphaerochaeta sp.]|nr:DpnD/PcfM family protein [Sphaerochaeta sp.]